MERWQIESGGELTCGSAAADEVLPGAGSACGSQPRPRRRNGPHTALGEGTVPWRIRILHFQRWFGSGFRGLEWRIPAISKTVFDYYITGIYQHVKLLVYGLEIWRWSRSRFTNSFQCVLCIYADPDPYPFRSLWICAFCVRFKTVKDTQWTGMDPDIG